MRLRPFLSYHVDPTQPKARLRPHHFAGAAMVGAIVLSIHALYTADYATVERTARAVNISGMQRMLSQRIALAAATLESDPEAADELAMVADRFAANAEWLQSQGGTQSRLTSNFVAHARTLTTATDEGVRAEAASFIASTRLQVLDELDAAVGRYEARAERRIGWLKVGLWYLSSLAGLMLIWVALAVFRPAIRRLEHALDRVEVARDELQHFADEVHSPVAASRNLIATAIQSIEEYDVRKAASSLERARCSLDQIDGMQRSTLVTIPAEAPTNEGREPLAAVPPPSAA